MKLEDRGLIDALNTSLINLKQGIDTHCCLIDSIVDEQFDVADLKLFSGLHAQRPGRGTKRYSTCSRIARH